MSLIDRFVSASGKRLLIEALSKQAIVFGSVVVAKRLAVLCTVEEFSPGAKLIEQGGSDNDLLFVLGGSVKIIINGREVGKRNAGQHVGEMALLDVSARRAATVIASEETVVARISEPDFANVANDHSVMWRLIAIELADRLRQRSRFIKEPNPQPHLFIGSSRESLPVAEAIKDGLASMPFSTYLWTDDIFTASKTNIESLESELERSDFAILVLGPDDKVFSRGKDAEAPRDNVLFELGLFMGALSRRRTFFVIPTGLNLKIPSDLLGVTPLQYDPGKLANLSESILKLIMNAGPK